jgi:hypothetical protein
VLQAAIDELAHAFERGEQFGVRVTRRLAYSPSEEPGEQEDRRKEGRARGDGPG